MLAETQQMRSARPAAAPLTRRLCSPCIRPDAGFWRSCPGCQQAGRITAGRCMTCRLRKQLRGLLGGPDGTIRPGLQALHDNLAGHERPATVLGWLHKGATAILRELGAGRRPLTHAALDELPDGKPLRAPASPRPPRMGCRNRRELRRRTAGPSSGRRSHLAGRSGHSLTAAGFTDVNITGGHEPVYYGPDAASALRVMLSLQTTKALLHRWMPRAPGARSASCAPSSPHTSPVVACSSTRAPGSSPPAAHESGRGRQGRCGDVMGGSTIDNP